MWGCGWFWDKGTSTVWGERGQRRSKGPADRGAGGIPYWLRSWLVETWLCAVNSTPAWSYLKSSFS